MIYIEYFLDVACDSWQKVWTSLEVLGRPNMKFRVIPGGKSNLDIDQRVDQGFEQVQILFSQWRTFQAMSQTQRARLIRNDNSEIKDVCEEMIETARNLSDEYD